MRVRMVLLLLVTAVFLAVQPANAQHRHSSPGFHVRPPVNNFPPTNTGNPNFNFIPGFGLQPVVHERFPVPGFGFDFEHDRLVNGRRRHFFPGGGFGGGFVGGSFFGPNFGVSGFFPFFPVASSSSSVVYIQQPVPVPVIIEDLRGRSRSDYDEDPVAVAAGLPDDWPRLRVAANSYAPVQQPLPQLTLLVLKNEKILAVKEYWLEDGLIFYVTSSGRQGSLAVRDLDWEMTTRLNSDRGLDFAVTNEN